MTIAALKEDIATLEESLAPQADGPSMASMFGTVKESKEELEILKAQLVKLGDKKTGSAKGSKPKGLEKMEAATAEVGEAAKEIKKEAKGIEDKEIKEVIVEAAKDIDKEVEKSEKAAKEATSGPPSKKEVKEMVAVTKKIEVATEEIKEAAKEIEDPQVKKEIEGQVEVLEEKIVESHKAEEKIAAPTAGKKVSAKKEAGKTVSEEEYSYTRKLAKEELEKLPIVVQEMRYMKLGKDSYVNTISGKKKFAKGHYVTFNKDGYVTNVFAAKSFADFCKKCKGLDSLVPKESLKKAKEELATVKDNTVSKATVEKHKLENKKLEEQFKKANSEKRRLRGILNKNEIDYTPGSKEAVATASSESEGVGLLDLLNVDLFGSDEVATKSVNSKAKAKTTSKKKKVVVAKKSTSSAPAKKTTATQKKTTETTKPVTKKATGSASSDSPKKASCNIKDYKGEVPAPVTRYLLEEVEAYKGYEGDVKSRRKTAELYKIDRVYRNTETGQVVVRKVAKAGGLARVLAGDNYKYYSICLDRGTEKLYKGSVYHNKSYKGGTWRSLIRVEEIKKMYADKGDFDYCLKLGQAAYDAPKGSKAKSEKYKEHYAKCGDQKGKSIAREYVGWLNTQLKKEAKEGEFIKARWIRVLRKIRSSVKGK